jgi:hypothetical protein
MRPAAATVLGVLGNVSRPGRGHTRCPLRHGRSQTRPALGVAATLHFLSCLSSRPDTLFAQAAARLTIRPAAGRGVAGELTAELTAAAVQARLHAPDRDTGYL